MGTEFVIAVGVFPVELLAYQVSMDSLQIDRDSSFCIILVVIKDHECI